MHRFHLVKIEVSRFNRSTLASHICSTDSIPWVHHLREEGSLDYDGRLVRLQVYLKFNMIIHRQHCAFIGKIYATSISHKHMLTSSN
jgi:hypothetical protein